MTEKSGTHDVEMALESRVGADTLLYRNMGFSDTQRDISMPPDGLKRNR